MVLLGNEFFKLRFGMQFDLTSLGDPSRVESEVSTGFGGGSLKGSFSKIYGSLIFPSNLPIKQGENPDGCSQSSFWLRQDQPRCPQNGLVGFRSVPKVAFRMNGLKNTNWTGRY